MCYINKSTLKRLQTSYHIKKWASPWFSYDYWKEMFVDFLNMYLYDVYSSILTKLHINRI